MRRFTPTVTSKAARRVAARANATDAKAGAEAAESAANQTEEVFREHVMPKPKPSSLPEDGTPVFRKGVPIRGKLSRLPGKEKFIICLVFSLTGSSAVLFVRPTLKYFVDNGFMGLPKDAGFVNGPWLYRFLYFCVMWPVYSLLLYSIGGLFGRRIWFSHMLVKMWGRILPKRGKEYLRYMLDIQ